MTVKMVTVSFAVTFSFESQSGCEGKPARTAASDQAGNTRNNKKNTAPYFIRDTRYKILYTSPYEPRRFVLPFPPRLSRLHQHEFHSHLRGQHLHSVARRRLPNRGGNPGDASAEKLNYSAPKDSQKRVRLPWVPYRWRRLLVHERRERS